MKRGLLVMCLVVLSFPVSALAASPSFEQALTSFLTEGRPTNFGGTVRMQGTDADLTVKVRGAGEKGKIPKTWLAVDVAGKVQGQIIDLSVEFRFKNGKTYIRLDDSRPDVFFSHWEGVKGKWYVLPSSFSDDDIEKLLGEKISTDMAAQIAELFDVIVTRFQTGHSFTYALHSVPGLTLEGKIDTSTENEFRYLTAHVSWAQADMTVTADFKAQRQFVSVYVETPRGKLTNFPFGSLAKNPLLKDIAGGEALSEMMQAADTSVPPVMMQTPPARQDMMPEPQVETNTIVTPQATVTVRSRAVQTRTDARNRAVLDHMARRQRRDLHIAKVRDKQPVPAATTDNEQLRIFATTLAGRMRGADLRAVIASGTAAVLPMKTLFGLLKDAGMSDGVTYVYLVAPTKGTDSFKLLVDNYTLLSNDLLDVDKNGTVDPDEKPAVPGTVYVNSLFTQALKAPVIETVKGESTVYVAVKDGDGNVLAVLAVSETAR